MRYAHRLLLPISCLLTLLMAQPAQAGEPPPLIRVRIAYERREELAQLEQAGVDIWEVHPSYAVAVVSGEQETVLIRRGYELERLGTVSPLFTFDPQYHTTQEMGVSCRTWLRRILI